MDLCLGALTGRKSISSTFIVVPSWPWISAWVPWQLVSHSIASLNVQLLHTYSMFLQNVCQYCLTQLISHLCILLSFHNCMSFIILDYAISWPSHTVFLYLWLVCDRSFLSFLLHNSSIVFTPWSVLWYVFVNVHIWFSYVSRLADHLLSNKLHALV